MKFLDNHLSFSDIWAGMCWWTSWLNRLTIIFIKSVWSIARYTSSIFCAMRGATDPSYSIAIHPLSTHSTGWNHAVVIVCSLGLSSLLDVEVLNAVLSKRESVAPVRVVLDQALDLEMVSTLGWHSQASALGINIIAKFYLFDLVHIAFSSGTCII